MGPARERLTAAMSPHSGPGTRCSFPNNKQPDSGEDHSASVGSNLRVMVHKLRLNEGVYIAVEVVEHCF